MLASRSSRLPRYIEWRDRIVSSVLIKRDLNFVKNTDLPNDSRRISVTSVPNKHLSHQMSHSSTSSGCSSASSTTSGAGSRSRRHDLKLLFMLQQQNQQPANGSNLNIASPNLLSSSSSHSILSAARPPAAPLKDALNKCSTPLDDERLPGYFTPNNVRT